MSAIIKNWTSNNIFGFKKLDATLHFFLTILIPAVVAFISLKHFPKDCIAIAYCYLSILISALNSFCDIVNRWTHKRKKIVNTKLFIMGIPVCLVIFYCTYGLFYTLLTQSIEQLSFTWMLYTYFITVAVAFADIVACFSRDMALMKACA